MDENSELKSETVKDEPKTENLKSNPQSIYNVLGTAEPYTYTIESNVDNEDVIRTNP
jgi:hypothetical protein